MTGSQKPKRFYSPIFKALVLSGQFAKMSEAAVRVLIVLDCHCNGTWECFLKFDTLMRETGFGSPTTISKAVKELTALGMIEKLRGKGKSCNHYRLMPPEMGEAGSTVSVEQGTAGTTASVEQEKAGTTLGEVSSYTSRPDSGGSSTASVDEQEIREQDSEQERRPAGGVAGLFSDDGPGKGGDKRAKREIVIPEKLAEWRAGEKRHKGNKISAGE